MKQEVFKAYSQYYNLFYSDKDYVSEVEYVDRVIKTFSPRASTIVEYGSGTGGHGLLLQRKGYQMLGIEQSEDMARIAREKGYQCLVGNILDVGPDTRKDVCLALFHVISYVNSNSDLISLFKKTRACLNDKGLFVFDTWFSPAVMHTLPEVRVKKAEDPDVMVTRIAQPDIDYARNVVTVNYQVLIKSKATGEYVEVNEAHPMRHFSVPEIELLAEVTGFKLLKAEEFLTGNAPSNKTWGVNFILQAGE